MVVRVVGRYTFVYYFNKLYYIEDNKKALMTDKDRDYFIIRNRHSIDAFFGVSLLYDYTESTLEVAKEFQGNVYRNISRCTLEQLNQLILELHEYSPVDWFDEKHKSENVYFISFIFNKSKHVDIFWLLRVTTNLLGALWAIE